MHVEALSDTAIAETIDPNERVRELELQLEKITTEYGDLANMGAILASLLNLEEVLAALMEMAMRMVDGQVGAIILKTPEGLVPKVSWGLDHRVLPKLEWEGEPIVERTLRESEAALLAPYGGPPIAIDSLVLHVDTAVSLPIITQTDTVGCVVIVNRNSGGNFSERDQIILETLVNFGSVAVENARLLSESLEKQRLEHEMSLAQEVQKTLVPRSNLIVGNATVESLYIPAGGVGGDYFDVLTRDDGTYFLVVGDVSSKGMPAALIMTAVRSVVRAAAKRTASVAQIVNEINRVVCEDLTGQKEMFVTFFIAKIDPSEGLITYTNAGHLPPMLWRKDSTAVTELGKGGVFIGQFAEFEYTESTDRFEPGDRLLAFTDGIVEAADPEGNLYGRERLMDFLRENACLPVDGFLTKLRDDLQENFAHADYIDDVTAVFVEFGGKST